MRRAEWTLLRAELCSVAKMKYRYFVPERCKHNAIFFSHQNRSYLDNISTNRWCIVGFSKSTAAAKWRMKINLKNTVGTELYFSSMLSMTSMLASVIQGLLILQNHCCKKWPLHFARIWDFFRGDQFSSTNIIQWWTFYMSWLVQTSKSRFAPNRAGCSSVV